MIRGSRKVAVVGVTLLERRIKMDVVATDGHGHLVLSQEAAEGLNIIIQQLLQQNQERRGRVTELTDDHKVMGDHLEQAREREHVWRTQVGALREEVAGLRARLEGGHQFVLAHQQREVLGGCFDNLGPSLGWWSLRRAGWTRQWVRSVTRP
jgi:hypothetical protein